MHLLCVAPAAPRTPSTSEPKGPSFASQNRLLGVGISMLNHRWLVSSALVASALHGYCAAAQDSHCTGALGEVEVRRNLDITARCQLTGTDVRGNVTLFSGGSLIARDVSIRGNLDGKTR